MRYASGGTSSLEIEVTNDELIAEGSRPARPIFGVTSMNGVPGDEIVLLVDDRPASFALFKVVTFERGRLQFLPPPPGQRWFVGATVGSGGEGYTCRQGRLTQVLDGPAHPKADGTVTWREVRTTYRWDGIRWSRLRRRVLPAATRAGAGWNCPGLRDL